MMKLVDVFFICFEFIFYIKNTIVNIFYPFKEFDGNGFKLTKEPFPHLLLKSQMLCRQVFGQETYRPPALALGNLFKRWLGDCLGCINTSEPVWTELKKIFKPVFEKAKKESDSQRDHESWDKDLIAKWDLQLNYLHTRTVNNETPVNINEVVYNLPLKWVLRRIFGPSFIADHADLFEDIGYHAQIIMANVFNNRTANYWFYQFFDNEANTALRTFQQNWQLILEKAKADESETVREQGIFHQLLENYEQSRKENAELTFQMFSQTLVEIIYANQDVTLPSAAWLLTHYSLFPLESSTDTAYFIEESARLSPVFPTSMPKMTMKDMMLDGQLIRAGTTALLDFEAVGKSAEWTSNDLDLFRPERFKNIDMGYFVSRFGCGGRKCPGRHVANDLFKNMLEHLQEKWLLIPAHPTTLLEIEKDPSKPFSTPSFAVWPVKKSEFKVQPGLLYYDCSPMANTDQRSFMAISVNKKSPFLADQLKVDMVVKFLAQLQEESVILIADDIARFNIEAFDHMRGVRAWNEAEKQGTQLYEKFRQSISKYGNKNVQLCRWKDVGYNSNVYEDLEAFPNIVERARIIAKKFIEGRGQGKINDSYNEKEALVIKYILSEIPVLLCGLRYNARWYRLLYYCGSNQHLSKFANDKNSLHNLVLDIHRKPEFHDVRTAIFHLCGLGPGAVGPNYQLKTPGFIGINLDSNDLGTPQY